MTIINKSLQSIIDDCDLDLSGFGAKRRADLDRHDRESHADAFAA